MEHQTIFVLVVLGLTIGKNLAVKPLPLVQFPVVIKLTLLEHMSKRLIALTTGGIFIHYVTPIINIVECWMFPSLIG
jgi:hypothetical protein